MLKRIIFYRYSFLCCDLYNMLHSPCFLFYLEALWLHVASIPHHLNWAFHHVCYCRYPLEHSCLAIELFGYRVPYLVDQALCLDSTFTCTCLKGLAFPTCTTSCILLNFSSKLCHFVNNSLIDVSLFLTKVAFVPASRSTNFRLSSHSSCQTVPLLFHAELDVCARIFDPFVVYRQVDRISRTSSFSMTLSSRLSFFFIFFFCCFFSHAYFVWSIASFWDGLLTWVLVSMPADWIGSRAGESGAAAAAAAVAAAAWFGSNPVCFCVVRCCTAHEIFVQASFAFASAALGCLAPVDLPSLDKLPRLIK